MKRKNEILKEMATVINYSDSTSFSNIVMIYANVETQNLDWFVLLSMIKFIHNYKQERM